MKPKILPEGAGLGSVRFAITGSSWSLLDGTLLVAGGTTTADGRSLIVKRETLASLLQAINDLRRGQE